MALTPQQLAKIPDGPVKDAIAVVASSVSAIPTRIVEHTVDFDSNHVYPLPGGALATQTHGYASCGPLANPCGYVTHQGSGGGPGATLDVKVGGVSVLPGGVPQVIGTNAPGVPALIIFVPAIVVPPGVPITYIVTDGGAVLYSPTVLVRWEAP